jgi:hypothetical protein
MEKILIIKAGSTMPSLAARRGDFEDWILAGTGAGALDQGLRGHAAWA